MRTLGNRGKDALIDLSDVVRERRGSETQVNYISWIRSTKLEFSPKRTTWFCGSLDVVFEGQAEEGRSEE